MEKNAHIIVSKIPEKDKNENKLDYTKYLKFRFLRIIFSFYFNFLSNFSLVLIMTKEYFLRFQLKLTSFLFIVTDGWMSE